MVVSHGLLVESSRLLSCPTDCCTWNAAVYCSWFAKGTLDAATDGMLGANNRCAVETAVNTVLHFAAHCLVEIATQDVLEAAVLYQLMVGRQCCMWNIICTLLPVLPPSPPPHVGR